MRVGAENTGCCQDADQDAAQDASSPETLKQIIMALETAMRKGYNIKLFLRIGWLKLVDGTVHFDNNASAKDLDL